MAGPDAASLEYLNRAYVPKTADGNQVFYDEWATHYDAHTKGYGYTLPASVAEALLLTLSDPQRQNLARLKILDAGCGTGQVGVALAEKGFKNIVGLDYSNEMLVRAKKTGTYDSVELVDLTKPVAQKDDSFDAVVCVGTFTAGHVPADPALSEMVRIIKPGGLVVATVLDKVWESGGFDVMVNKLSSGSGLSVSSRSDVSVIDSPVKPAAWGSSSTARIMILQKS